MTAAIRLANATDGQALAAIYGPAVSDAAISFELEPPAAEEMAARVARNLEYAPWIVCESQGGVVGFAYASRHRDRAAYQWSVDVSAYVASSARRWGVARALYSSLFAILVLQGFRNAYAGITLPNIASVGLHEAMGFSKVGVYSRVGYKQGSWHDVAWLERTLAPHCPEPPLPKLLPEVLDTQAFRDALDSGLRLLRLPAR
jgi:L-amino acid N-acyltransferase YncA